MTAQPPLLEPVQVPSEPSADPPPASSPHARPVTIYDLAVVKSYLATVETIVRRTMLDDELRFQVRRDLAVAEQHLEQAADELDALTTILRRGAEQRREQERRRGRTVPTHPTGGYAHYGCRCAGCR